MAPQAVGSCHCVRAWTDRAPSQALLSSCTAALGLGGSPSWLQEDEQEECCVTRIQQPHRQPQRGKDSTEPYSDISFLASQSVHHGTQPKARSTQSLTEK